MSLIMSGKIQLTSLPNGLEDGSQKSPDLTIFLPAPGDRALSLQFPHRYPAPYAGNLGGRPFHMLNQGCACRKNVSIRPSLSSKQVQSCLINDASGVRLIIRGDDKLLKDVEVVLFYDGWVLTGFFKDRGHFRANFQCLLCTFPATKKLTHHR